MKLKSKVITMLLVLIITLFNSIQVFATTTNNDTTKLEQFYQSVLKGNNYITYIIEVTEDDNNQYSIGINYSEYLNGAEFGFVSFKDIIKQYSILNIPYAYNYDKNTGYITIKASMKVDQKNLVNLINKIFMLKIKFEDNQIAGCYDTVNIYNSYNNDVIKKILSTNKYAFVYNTKRNLASNADSIKKNNDYYRHAWALPNNTIGYIYTLNKGFTYYKTQVLHFLKSNLIFIIIILVIIIIFIIIRIRKKKIKNSNYDDESNSNNYDSESDSYDYDYDDNNNDE